MFIYFFLRYLMTTERNEQHSKTGLLYRLVSQWNQAEDEEKDAFIKSLANRVDRTDT